jgi:hypothetical protein
VSYFARSGFLLRRIGRHTGLMAKLGEIAGLTFKRAMFLDSCSLMRTTEKFFPSPEPMPAVTISPLKLYHPEFNLLVNFNDF